MKSYKVLSLRTLSLVTLMALLSLAGCKKDTEQPAVNISGFTPTQGVVGTSVTISGNNFSTIALSNVVTFNGTAATVTSATATSIIVTVPQGATSGKIAITSGGKSTNSTSDFTILAPPTITSFAPVSGNVSSSVVITGTNFDATPANNVVTFNGTAATVTAATATSLTVIVPAGATTGKISITVNGIAISSATDFTVVPGPTVTSFTPATGQAGTIVVITGTNFDANGANDVVRFGTTTAQIVTASATQLTVILPAGATTGKIAVSAVGFTGNSLTDFTVLSDPYANFRVKQVQGTDGSLNQYTYDASNNITTDAFFDGITTHIDFNYTYTNGVISTEIYENDDVAYKTTYSYNNGVLSQKTSSSANIESGVIGAYTATFLSNFTFQNGWVSTEVDKDGSNIIGQHTYTYAIINGTLQQTEVYTSTIAAGLDDTYTTVYSSAFFPFLGNDQSQINMIPAGYKDANSSIENYSSYSSFDDSGKLLTYKVDYTDPTKTDVTFTFTYEAKQ